jgi:4-amino-4-deoxy-L-arabinose transferase-like glycosyltransferase
LHLGSTIERRPALYLLVAITALGAAARFYGLGWGAPYYHFHQDEHYVFASADMLRRDPHEAAMSPKFFMYSPLVPYLINIGRYIYETLSHPLNLSLPHDEVIYMVIGRGISAAIGTATVPVVYAITARVYGRLAGLLAAFFLACAVVHVQSSHFATTDVAMAFFCALALWCSIRLVERTDIATLVGAGLAFAGAILCKYSGGFVLGVVGLAYLLGPSRPTKLKPVAPWTVWLARGTIPIVVGFATFLALDPLVWSYFAKFQSDIKEWVTDPLTGVSNPIWAAQFADLKHPELYWFTNLLWWGLGPGLEIVGLGGVVWLFLRWDKRAALLAAFPVVYFIATGHVNTPFARYAIPLAPALAITAGGFSDALLRLPAGRRWGQAVVLVATMTTGLCCLAYMNVYRQPDSRLQASAWLLRNVPRDAHVLVEPSQNTPPMGSYLTATDFGRDYVLWGPPRTNPDRRDYYQLHTLDGYRALYNRGPSDDDRRNYIAGRLALADWIVMDDSYLQWYRHLPSAEHEVMKDYYRELFDGKLGFALVRTFKTYPALLGWNIDDDRAEMTFRHFDHPRVFIFRRYARAAPQTQ